MFFGKPLMCDFSKMSEKIRKADVVVEMDMKGIDIKTKQVKSRRSFSESLKLLNRAVLMF